MGKVGASSICEVLRQNTNVQSIQLKKNEIRDVGASSIVQLV